MGFWIYMLIISTLIPFTMLLFGIYFRKNAPKNINSVFGYRTSMSMKNMNTWKFAHRYCGRLWTLFSLVLLPVLILVMVSVYGKSENLVGYVGASCLLLPLIFIIVSIALTEAALKKNFDEFGHHKN